MPAIRQSSYRIQCISPPYPVTGWITLEVHSYSGIAESASAFYYQPSLTRAPGSLESSGYGAVPHAMPVMLGPVLAPSLGPVAGGTLVSVTAQNFPNTESLSCRFGAHPYTVIARYLTSRTLECMAPAHPPGQVSLTVSLNGQQFVSLNAEYLFHEIPRVAAIEPGRGPAEGGTLMQIHGDHFSMHAAAIVTCRIGTIAVPATVRDSHKLHCLSPTNPMGFVMVEVSNNLQDFTTSGILFFFVLVSIREVQPHSASQLGGDELAISGTNFMSPHERELYCLVGTSRPVPARWESAQLVTCETQSTRQIGAVPVSLRSNETAFKATTVLILTPRPHVDAIMPAKGPVRGGTKITISGVNLPTGEIWHMPL